MALGLAWPGRSPALGSRGRSLACRLRRVARRSAGLAGAHCCWLLAPCWARRIFAVLGGAALLLFAADGGARSRRCRPRPTAWRSRRRCRRSRCSRSPASCSPRASASQRLLRCLPRSVGWMPGGTAVVCALVCAFFTVFTGGSGVTILALGGLLLPALLAATATASASRSGCSPPRARSGCCFPPALPLILYGIVAADPDRGPVHRRHAARAAAGGAGRRLGRARGPARRAPRTPFDLARGVGGRSGTRSGSCCCRSSCWSPIFGGFATLVEAAALTALYAFVVQCFVHRDLSRRAATCRAVFTQCVVLVGGVLIILGVAMGLTSYLVDAQVPARLLDWVQALHPLAAGLPALRSTCSCCSSAA